MATGAAFQPIALSMRFSPSFFLSSRSSLTFCAFVLREKKGQTFGEQSTRKTEYRDTMGLYAIIDFASACRHRIMPSRALAYSLEDLFRHAHNR